MEMTKRQVNSITGNKRYMVTGYRVMYESDSLIAAVRKAREFAIMTQRWGIVKRKLRNGQKRQVYICTYDINTQSCDESWTKVYLTKAEQTLV